MADKPFTLVRIVDSICGKIGIADKIKLENHIRKQVSTADIMPGLIAQLKVIRPSYADKIRPGHIAAISTIVEAGRGIPPVYDIGYQVAGETYKTDQDAARQIYRGLILKEVQLQQKYISQLVQGIIEAIGLKEQAPELMKGINESFEHNAELKNMKTPEPKDFDSVIGNIRERAEKLYESGILYIAKWITERNIR